MPRGAAHLIALAVGCALALPAVAAAGPGDSHGAPSGGSSALPRPVVDEVLCRTDCAGLRSARPGSKIRLRGRHLKRADTVVFLGGKGARDDIEVVVHQPRARRIDLKVPRTAASGRVAVANPDGVLSRARPSARLEIGPAPDLALLRGGGRPRVVVEMQGQRVYFDGPRKATLVYLVRGAPAKQVNVELIRLADGAAIARWKRADVPADVPQTVRWGGKAGGRVQRNGRYAFRVYAESPDGQRAQSAETDQTRPDRPGPGEFTFLRHRFPVLGAYGYGGYGASFGGGRSHQGQDVFAACGTPLVAARGGVVKHKAYHVRAGHYIVIDGAATGTDYAYMHLREASPLEKGERVRTGQRIGRVGDTGRAYGCHLHFEMWSAPGWYTGGQPFDPLPSLKAWTTHR
jgi:murein DD-endopeptidase MepM/ murein hydrolase activator NlpD